MNRLGYSPLKSFFSEKISPLQSAYVLLLLAILALDGNFNLDFHSKKSDT